MTAILQITATLLAAVALIQPAAARALQSSAVVYPDTVHVAPPTGEQEFDRESILAALVEVEPGGMVQFARGTYLIGEVISVTVPRVTLLGHPDGTTLRGCDPDDMGTREYARVHCNGIELAGARQTVRGLTFEYAYWALHLGCCWGEQAMLRAPDGTLVEGPAIYRTEGGHLVEGNTFRRSASGIRMNGDWSEPAVVRGNRFVDNWHSVSINGNTVHLLDNDFSVPEPERVPFYGFPNDAVQIGAPLPFQGGEQTRARTCAHNVVAGNRIAGSHNGISIMLWAPGSSCRNNVIRENTITVRRARVPSPEWFTLVDESDSTFVGIPLSLLNYPAAFGQNEPGQESAIEDNLIEGNRIIGAEGLGIEVLHASGNLIVGNTIRGIAVRDPFPGNTMGPRGEDLEWREANGSAIWVSPGGDENEILGNTFEDIASHAVVLEGDSNRVEVRNTSDSVRDLASGNRISRSTGDRGRDAEGRSHRPYESKFVHAGGVRVHYLDFGGEGLPLIFVHSESWDAYAFADFAQRFAGPSRVLSITRPGYGASEAHPGGYDVATQAEALVKFLDALGIERAVFAGNSSPTKYMTYLAERHQDRLAGLIYLAGLLPFWVQDAVEADPTGAGAMASRAVAGPDAFERHRIQAAYRPDFLKGNSPSIEVPALAFAARSGTIGHERFNEALVLSGSKLMAEFYRELEPSPLRDYIRGPVEDPEYRTQTLERIQDPEVRGFFLNLADDPERQAEIWQYQKEVVGPALVAGQKGFRRAFGEDLQVIRLDVPVIHGYEYRDAPELIEPHVQRFLEEVRDREEANRNLSR